MSSRISKGVGAALSVAALGVSPVAAQEGIPTLEELRAIQSEIQTQQEELKQQQDSLNQQQQQINEQMEELSVQRQQLDSALERLEEDKAAAEAQPQPQPRPAPAPTTAEANGETPTQVGQAPEREVTNQDISIISDIGGVLTRRGTLIVDPMVEYNQSGDNRFFFQGVQIVDAVLIGIIEATDIDRNVLISSLGLRYGITNFIEVDMRVPYQYRQDRFDFTPVGAGTSRLRDISGNGLGDIEAGIHWQVNKRRQKLPYAVVNVRVKSDTGEGPFEINRDSEGVETELPTGSGFWAVEPSVTLIYPSDPAVLFVNLGYLYNIPEDVDRMIAEDTIVGRVEPGNAFKASFGAGIGLNDRLSMSFGYEHSYIQETRTEIGVLDDTTGMFEFIEVKGRSAQVGSFLWGVSYVLNERVNLLFNLGVGATSDAPDVRVMIRAPIKLYTPE